jgi:23S rRNA pseudouridine2605 synthase
MWLRVILKEGRKRQIRETGSTLGLPVVKIIRVRIGSLMLGGMKPREWRYLTAEEIAGLKGELGKSGPGRGKVRAIPEKARSSSPPRSGLNKREELSRTRKTSERGKRK